MLQILGKCLVLIGMTAFGLQQAMGLRRRVSCLREFQSALERLERELAFALLPVPILLAQMRDGARGPAYHFFASCEERFCQRGEERLEEIWKEELMGQSLPIQEEDKSLLQEIGGILGRYDGDSQRLAFQRIHSRLDDMIVKAKEEAERMGRVYSALGITVGMFCIIML